jgi:hypothetical protein
VGSAARRALASTGGEWDMRKTTRGQDEAEPMGEGTRGAVAGEVSGQGRVIRLRERMLSRCTPGVRRYAAPQSAVDRGREGEDKHESSIPFDWERLGESSGTVSPAEELVLKMRHALGHLGNTRERGD